MLEVCVGQAANMGKAKAFNRCIRVLLMHDALVSSVLHSRRCTHDAPSRLEGEHVLSSQSVTTIFASRLFSFLFFFFKGEHFRGIIVIAASHRDASRRMTVGNYILLVFPFVEVPVPSDISLL